MYSHWSGRHVRETCRWIRECRFEQKPVRFVERFHKVHSVERETSQGIYVVREEIDKSTRPDHVWPEVWTKIGKAAQKLEKQEWKNERQCSKIERNLLYLSWWPRLQRNSQKREENIGKTYGSRHVVQKEGSNQYHEGGCKAGSCIPKPTPIIFQRPELRDFVVDSRTSMHVMSRKELSSEELWTVKRSRTPTVVLTGSVRSWLESFRNRATARRNACCPIARQALQRSRILLRVSQRSKPTIDPKKRENHYLQDKQFRTSCRSKVICQFWKFVSNIATIGIDVPFWSEDFTDYLEDTEVFSLAHFSRLRFQTRFMVV